MSEEIQRYDVNGGLLVKDENGCCVSHGDYVRLDLENNRLNEQLNKIAEVMHYPECWDTVAYPTLLDAVLNSGLSGCNPDDCTKG